MIRRTACLIALGGEPYRNLAIEKHLMDTLPEDTAILYLWQNDRCISIGRCQNPLYECRVDPFLSAGGHIARRLSGGGAVYQDRGALNFSFILPKTAFDIHHQLSILGMAAGAFGIQSRAMGRGDLFAAGRRFSVNAYFKAGSAALHHGTLYVDTALDQMAQFLSAGGGDLAAPNPPDTAAHTINLRTLNPAITVEELEQALYWAFAVPMARNPPGWTNGFWTAVPSPRSPFGSPIQNGFIPRQWPPPSACRSAFPGGRSRSSSRWTAESSALPVCLRMPWRPRSSV